MKRTRVLTRRSLRLCLALLAACAAGGAQAQALRTAVADFDCNANKITTYFFANDVGGDDGWVITYQLQLGTARRSGRIEGDSPMPNGIVEVSDMKFFGNVPTPFVLTGTATLYSPASQQRNTIDITDDGGSTSISVNCEEPVAALGDFVFEDLDGDGIQDAGEPGIADVPVTLQRCVNGVPGAIVENLTTNNNGRYLFPGLSPGEYKVNFSAPVGTAFTQPNQGSNDFRDSDADPATGMTPCTTLRPNQTNRTLDAGLVRPAALGDFVFLDNDNDGLQDSNEPGVNGVNVRLVDCEGNPVTDFDGAPIGTTQTANDGLSDGIYGFDNLLPGCYVVKVDPPAGFGFTDKGDGTTPDLDSNINPGTAMTDRINLASGETDPTIDAGLVREQSQGLGDLLFEDLNGNGIQNPGEPGIADTPVRLLLGNCTTPTGRTTTTDSQGLYRFDGLQPGTYCVDFELPEICDLGAGEAAFTRRNRGGDDRIDSDVNARGISGAINLVAGELDLTIDAGVYCPAKLGDQVFADDDADGVQDNVPVDEAGIAGVSVNLLRCNGQPTSDLDGNGSLETDADGMYMFRVRPGFYRVEFVAPSGQSFSPANVGGNDALDSDANQSTGVTACTRVNSDTFNRTVDAGLTQDPQQCGLTVDAKCAVLAPANPQPFECEGKIDAIAMRYDGSLGDLMDVQAFVGDAGTSRLPVTINGDLVSVSGYQSAGAPNNVVWLTQGTAGSTQSTFHLSCSDKEMDGETDTPAFPNDCGRPQGDGKDSNGSGTNTYLLAGLETERGRVLECMPPEPVFTESCTFPVGTASCGTGGKTKDKPETMTFRFTGGSCAASNNAQDKFKCSGSINAGQPVTIGTKDQSPISVAPGASFTLRRDNAKELELSNGGGTQEMEIHTSCSQPLVTDDTYGGLTLVALGGVGGGRDVQFVYDIANVGPGAVSGITLTDSLLGTVASGLRLAAGDSTRVEANSVFEQSGTVTASVTGSASNGAACAASDDVEITVTTN